MAEKLCAQCKQWTSWNHKDTDSCQHCGAVLGEKAIQEKENRIALDERQSQNDWFRPRETDGSVKVFFRKVAFIFHVIFGAIAWFFIWAFTATPG